MNAPSISDPIGDYFAFRLTGEPKISLPALDSLPLKDALRLCERLGQIVTAGPAATLPRQSPADLARARNLGIGIVNDLERATLAALDEALALGAATRNEGLCGAYGWIYLEWLATGDATAKLVKPILLRHAVENGIMSNGEPRLGNEPPLTLNLKQAAKWLGIGHERMRRVIEREHLLPSGSRRSVAFTLAPLDIAALANREPSTLSVRAAAARLKTGKAQVQGMAEAGLVFRSSDGLIAVSSIHRLLEQLRFRTCRESAPGAVVTIGNAARDASVSLCQISKAIICGQIPCWRCAGAGLKAFCVRPNDVAALRPTSTWLSVESAAKTLALHPDCVRALSRSGALARSKLGIPHEAVDRFRAKFVTGARLAGVAKYSPKILRQTLEAEGVAPAFNLSTYRQVIYERRALPKKFKSLIARECRSQD